MSAFTGMLSAIDRNHCPPSNGMPVRHHRNTHASLDAVKNPLRDSTMHIENKYTDTEAKHIFELVKGFMMKLSARMDEEGKPLA